MARTSARRLGALGILLVAVAPLAVSPTSSLARYVDSAAVGGGFTTDRLDPPTGLAATGGGSVTLTWMPTVDGYATGYDVFRSALPAGPFAVVGAVTPGTATTTVDGPPLGAWYYVLRAVAGSWTSMDSNVARALVSVPVSTGIRPCAAASNAADTVGAGDDDGYQSNPTRVCADDGSAANDTRSGTGGSVSCGTGAIPDSNKDRHRFWGYAFGLPGSVSAISGITVVADLGMNNNGGTTNLCIQLSWDGGSTWTTIQSNAVSGTAQSRYTFGSATDTWGRTWAVGDFSTTNFRVRVIDASTQTNKQFRLDFLGVDVDYYP